MTGSGTQTDPYIIWDWADFFNISDSAAYYKLGVNLDANDYNGGVWTTWSPSFLQLDGDGHKITNIYHNVASSASSYAIYLSDSNTAKNLEISNCKCGSLFIKNKSATLSVFDNCRISAEFDYLLDSASNYTTGTHFKNSVLSLKGKSLSNVNTTGYRRFMFRATRCHINVDLNTDFIGALRGDYNTCRVTGKLKSSLASCQLGDIANSMFAIDCTAEGSALTEFAFGSVESTSVIDSTLLGNVAVPSGFTALTTEQMQSADALNAAGFTVISV